MCVYYACAKSREVGDEEEEEEEEEKRNLIKDFKRHARLARRRRSSLFIAGTNAPRAGIYTTLAPHHGGARIAAVCAEGDMTRP